MASERIARGVAHERERERDDSEALPDRDRMHDAETERRGPRRNGSAPSGEVHDDPCEDAAERQQ